MPDASQALHFLRRRNQPPDIEARLFVFPFAGGGASDFQYWLERLPPSLDVQIWEMPGRGRLLTQPPLQDWPDLIARWMTHLEKHDERPFFFYGHSMGALIAYELCRHLHRAGRTLPRTLFLGAYRPPHTPPTMPLLASLPDEALLDAISSFGGLPRELRENSQFIHQILPMLRADFRLCDEYEHRMGEPLPCPITVMSGLDDNMLIQERLKHWRIHTSNTFKIQFFVGGHLFVRDCPEMVLSFLKNEIGMEA